MSFLNRMASSMEELVLLLRQLVETKEKLSPCTSCFKDSLSVRQEEPRLSDELEGLLSRKEVIDLLRIDPSTYTRWKNKGIIKCVTLGGRDYVREADLAEAIFESRRKGKT